MKKRIIFALVAAFLIAFAAVSASAEDICVEEGKRVAAAAAAMTFPADGSDCTAACPVCGKNVKWTALTAEDLSGGITLVKATHYYLAESVNAAGISITAPGSASHISCLHLNGKELTRTDGVVILGSAGTLNIMGSGEVKGSGNSGATYAATMHINTGGANGRINLYGGTYSKVNSDDTENVIAIRNNGGEINLYDGATIKSGSKGSAVYMWGGLAYVNATFNMYGGTIDATGSSEVAVDMAEVADGKVPKQSFNMYGGTIKNGNGTTGGNVTVRKNGTFNMYGGTITDGTATNGGNVYIDSYGTFNMYGGTVSGSRDENGTATGGTATNGGNFCLTAGATLNITGGEIKDGTAVEEGGNVYVKGTNTVPASVLIKNALISGGQANQGGNLSVWRMKLTVEDGTQILNGVATGRAGSVRAYQATIMMTGGTIGGGTSNYTSTNRPHDVWLAGTAAAPSKLYMLGGMIDSKDSCVGAAITAGGGSVLYLGGDATVINSNPANDAVYVSGGKCYICDGWSGDADVRFNDYKASGETISGTYGEVITLNADLTHSSGGSFTGKLAQSSMAVCQSGSSLVVQKAAMVDSDGYRTATADLLTDWVNGSYAYIQLYGDQTIEDLGGNTLWVDLNGYDLTVGGSGALQVFDSANDGYIASKCGSVTNNGTVVITEDLDAPNGNRYIAVTEESKTTMHRLEMELTAVTLRSTAAGLYYKALYSCDAALSAKVERYGVVVSLQNMPGADFLTEWNENRYTISNESFKSGVIATSGSVFGIMKDKNTVATNAAQGEMKIYANPYICFDMGRDMIVVGDKKNPGKTTADETFDGVAYSLRDTMNKIDEIYYLYDQENRKTIDAFRAQWAQKGMAWGFDNVGNTNTVSNENLTFTEGTKALCAVCGKEVTWTALTQKTHGTAGIGAATDGAHYYLAENIVYTGTESFVRAPGAGGVACLHLNGHTIAATDHRVITGDAGTINVLGNGTVSGNHTDEYQGAAVQIDTADANGTVNLYGGTYTKPVGNKTASVVAAWQGGNIQMYEDVTVRGTGSDYSIFAGKPVTANVSVSIHGATATGGSVYVAEPDEETTYTGTLDLTGDPYLEDVIIRSTVAQVNVSGAPVIDRLALRYTQLVTVGTLSEGADITVSTRECFTTANENIAQYAKYFRPYVETDSVTVVDDTLHYNINYELYMTPYQRDVSAEAIADGKIHYYFMAGEGMIMNPTTSGEIDKWGDSCLIVFPNGETMLVDTGYAVQAPVIIGNLKRMGIGSEENPLDYLLITHPHSDHIGGAFGPSSTFLDEIQVEQVYHNRIVATGDEETYWIENACTERNIPCAILEQGAELDFGDVHMQVLWPEAGTSEKVVSGGKINDLSMVFRLDYGEHSSLFTGDLYEAGEEDLMESVGTEILSVDFLKVPHHGWSTSSSEAFVNAVSPELAVATGRVEMPASYQKRYTDLDATLLFDMYSGYIHVESGSDGAMTYETSR